MNHSRTTPISTADDHETTLVGALRRHFADLRDGTHGPDQAMSRAGKEEWFPRQTDLLEPEVLAAMAKFNTQLLLGAGSVHDTGVQRAPKGLIRNWSLTWASSAGPTETVQITAHFGIGNHHPHLAGATVREWPLNVFTAQQAAAMAPVIQAILAAELHNLVFRRGYHVIPVTTATSGADEG